MSNRRHPRTPGSTRPAEPAFDSLELRRHSAARAGLVALGIGAGTGVLVSLLAVWTAAQPSSEADGSLRFSSMALLVLLGLLIGIAAGAVLAVPASLSTLVLRPRMLPSPGRARLGAGLQGAVGAAALAMAIRFWLLSSEFIDGSLVWFLVLPAAFTVAASAAAGPWIVNAPRLTKRSQPRPGTPRSGASPR